MTDIALTVNKESVYEEVAQTTSYTGAKMNDELAYNRIFTTDEDKSMLERFWNESKNTACNSLKKILLNEVEREGIYQLSLGVSSSFDEALTTEAATYMEDVMRKAFFKKRPIRPTYN